MECSLCGYGRENVSHVLLECSAYSGTRASFMNKLQELLEDDYEDLESLDNVEKSSYMLGSKQWENKFVGLLSLGKEYIVGVWEIRKHKLCDSDSEFGQQLHSRSSSWDLAVTEGQRNCTFSVNGKLGHSCARMTKSKLYDSRVRDHDIVHLGLNVDSFSHNWRCMVDGSNAMAAI